MKRILLALLLPATLMVMSFSGAQTPDANQEQRLLALIKEVQTQQAQLTENQAKIEEKLAVVTETVRAARIYSKREKKCAPESFSFFQCCSLWPPQPPIRLSLWSPSRLRSRWRIRH